MGSFWRLDTWRLFLFDLTAGLFVGAMVSPMFLAYGGWEACCIMLLRIFARSIATLACPDGWYDVGEGLFIFTFFAYLCCWVNMAITPELHAGGTNRCLHVHSDLTYCVQLHAR